MVVRGYKGIDEVRTMEMSLTRAFFGERMRDVLKDGT